MLVRMNAQLAPIEAALTRAGIAYQVRGLRFYDRPEVRGARSRARAARPGAGRDRARRCVRRGPRGDGSTSVGLRARTARRRRTAATRPASAQPSLDTLLDIVSTVAPRRRRPPMPRVSSRSSTGARAHERDGLGRRREPAHLPPGEGPRVGRGRSCRCSRRARCRSARRSTTTTRSPRSGGCSTSGSPGRASTSRSRGPSAARPAAARRRREPSRFLLDLRGPAASATSAARRSPRAARPARRRRRPAHRRAPCLAHGQCPRGRHAGLRHRPRRDPRGDRRGPAVDPVGACAASRASARPSSRPTATRSSPFSPVTSVTTSAARSTCRRDRPLSGKPMIAVETCHNR